MVSPLLKEFIKEKVVLLGSAKTAKLSFPLEGITRLVDKNGHMIAVVLDKNVWAEFLEYLEYSDPKFRDEIEASRKSGRVPSREIERRLGIK